MPLAKGVRLEAVELHKHLLWLSSISLMLFLGMPTTVAASISGKQFDAVTATKHSGAGIAGIEL